MKKEADREDDGNKIKQNVMNRDRIQFGRIVIFQILS